MIENIVVLTIVAGSMLVHDLPRLEEKSGREKMAYAAIATLSVYLGIDYLLPAKLPFFNEWLDWTIAKPAKFIADYLEGHF